ncbi:hypothetical protein UK23_38725 [Lentzea aerocolonigenes]|uniref:Uncharacterized protein n=1 Tax=Lentzea aerocolonigenes TaxID=68170 RepID=A0A0F0GEX4_LENAE|nr:hypothetical protein UK23_38725 [Lentzea aerocolonigenes]
MAANSTARLVISAAEASSPRSCSIQPAYSAYRAASSHSARPRPGSSAERASVFSTSISCRRLGRTISGLCRCPRVRWWSNIASYVRNVVWSLGIRRGGASASSARRPAACNASSRTLAMLGFGGTRPFSILLRWPLL